MKRRMFGLGLSMLGLLPFLSGCTETRPWLRPRSDDPARARTSADTDEEDKDKVLDVKSESKPFFKSSRLSGAMSSEGRDIERSLGIQ
jgi:hypothetical protein